MARRHVRLWALDLDGVIWLARRADPGCGRGRGPAARPRRARRLRHQQLRRRPGRAWRPSCARTGIDPPRATSSPRPWPRRPWSSRASGSWCAPAPGVRRGARGRGAVPVVRATADADAVRRRGRLPPRLRLRAAADRPPPRSATGARLLATNDDATYPTARRADPGRRGHPGRRRHRSGVAPIVAGKPHAADGRPGPRDRLGAPG